MKLLSFAGKVLTTGKFIPVIRTGIKAQGLALRRLRTTKSLGVSILCPSRYDAPYSSTCPLRGMAS
jgi:hypothetical protein